MTPAAQSLIDAINGERTQRGLEPLALNDSLSAAAQGHAEDMARHPGMIHAGSDGSYGGERIRAAGYPWTQWGEVVGWGFQGDPRAMVDWWMQSPAHQGYLLAENVDEIGVGYAQGGPPWGHYWTVNFGKGGSASKPPPDLGTGDGVDLLPYLCGDGRAYRVGNSRGSFEVFQSQTGSAQFYQDKAWDDLSVVNWEQFYIIGDAIGRDVDTSPGGGRYYRQFGATWVPRVMRLGQRFTNGKRVQFYRQADCAPLAENSGDVTDTITYAEYIPLWRSVFGVEVPDVVVLKWEQGGELYYYGRGYGLVGWRRLHGDMHTPEWSAIYEMRPDIVRLERLVIGCL